MTQQDTAVATARSQLLLADLPTGVRGQPGVHRGVPVLATEAAVLCGYL